MVLNKDYWNNKYITNDTGWDVGESSSPISSYFNQLTTKEVNILIPGCGNAHEAEYLHHRGFKNIYLLDYSIKALQNFSKRVPSFPASNLMCEDFFTHKGEYNIIVEQTFFCAITPSLREKYVQKMYDLLVAKGQLIGLLFNTTFEHEGPPFGGNLAEYKTLFAELFHIDTMETAYNSIAPRKERELFIQLIKKGC